MTIGFVAWAWSLEETAAASAEHLYEQLGPSWRLILDLPGLRVAVDDRSRGKWTADCLPGLDGAVIGRLFDRAATDAGGLAALSVHRWQAEDLGAIATRLVREAWGAYVLIGRDETGRLTVLRDPMGAQDCVTWQFGGLQIIASHCPDELADLVPRAIAWDRVAALLVSPARSGEALALADVQTIAPGVLTRFGARCTETVLWHPARLCPPAMPPRAADPVRLAELVDSCVAAWASLYPSAIAELSGGLDSSIVAAALHAADQGQVVRCYNFFTRSAAGDERCYARTVAERLGLPVRFVERDSDALRLDDIEAASRGLRPGFNAVDSHYDRAMAQHAVDAAAVAIVSGQGGDALFFQAPTALVAVESFPGAHRAIDRLKVLMSTARWTRDTIWGVGRQLLLERSAVTNVTPPPPVFLRLAPPRERHRWTENCEAVAPAKRLQIAGLANSCVSYGASLRSAVADMVHPLLSQPVVEFALGIPVLGLTGGTADRRLAREAYRRRLPASVIDRHGKGDLTAYYGRLIAATPWLRDYLCDGMLAAANVVDADLLAMLLEPERLAQEDHYTEILVALLVESWLRHWSGNR